MIDIIQKAIKQGIMNAGLVGVMEGDVVSAPPNLKIKLKNNSKLVIPKELLVVPEHLTTHSKICDISCSNVSTSLENFSNFNANGASVTFKNALKSGDKVMLISFEGGQRFYIMDRI